MPSKAPQISIGRLPRICPWSTDDVLGVVVLPMDVTRRGSLWHAVREYTCRYQVESANCKRAAFAYQD